MERRGSGLSKILNETAKLPGYTDRMKPEFFSTPSDFRVVLKNVNYLSETYKVQDTMQDTMQDIRMNQLVQFCITARSRDEMQSHIGIKNRDYFRTAYLKPLLDSGKLRMTIPDKPKSRNRRYVAAGKS